MRKIWIMALSAAMFAACGESAEESAEKLLVEARAAMEQGRFDDGRALIDSLRTTYPKALEGRRNAVRLENELEFAAAKKALADTDSALKAESAALEAMKAEFVLEKDAKYQAVGYYVSPDQVAAKMHRTALRGLVNEEGLMVLVSIVHGERLKHNTITVADEAGQEMATAPCFSFLTHNVVGYEEEASYKLGEDGGVVELISAASGKLKVTYNGASKSVTKDLSAADKNAVRHCHNLAKKYAAVRELTEKRKEHDLKVRFFEKKISMQ